MNKPPLPSPFSEPPPKVQLDEAHKKQRRRKFLRMGLILMAILLVLWIAANIWFYNVMYEGYYKHLPNKGL